MSLRPVGIIRNLFPSLFMWTPSNIDASDLEPLFPLKFRGETSPNQIGNVENHSLRFQQQDIIYTGPHIAMWDILGVSVPPPTTVARAQRPPGAPDALLVWPVQCHAPWQSPGPNELISQLEALDGRTGAARGAGGQGRGERGR